MQRFLRLVQRKISSSTTTSTSAATASTALFRRRRAPFGSSSFPSPYKPKHYRSPPSTTSGLYFHPTQTPKHETLWKQIASLLALAAIPAGIFLYGMQKEEEVPYTRRKRTMWLPNFAVDLVEHASSADLEEQYREMLLPANHPFTQTVVTIAKRLVEASGELGAKYNWEIFVVDAPIVNAMCLPGGKIIVYTGILEVCPSEAELAVVMAHEIAHALSQHGVEILGRNLLHLAGMFLLSLSFGIQIYSLGSWTTGKLKEFLFDLPFSKTMETEADYIGLLLMAKACYDPTIAPQVHENLGSGVTEENKYFSTHPPDQERAQNCKKWMTEALLLKEKSCPPKLWSKLFFNKIPFHHPSPPPPSSSSHPPLPPSLPTHSSGTKSFGEAVEEEEIHS